MSKAIIQSRKTLNEVRITKENREIRASVKYNIVEVNCNMHFSHLRWEVLNVRKDQGRNACGGRGTNKEDKDFIWDRQIIEIQLA